jgi:ribonucleoside-diphosphate reductase alpha chain
MSIKALQEYTRISKYAWYLPEKDRRETWGEQVDRVMGMHDVKFSDVLPDIQEELEFTRSMLMSKNVLGSQRALQFGGVPILRKNARMYNCISSYVDRPRFFQECMWLLLCGCGTGFSVQKHHVAKLPQLRQRDAGSATFIVPDTIEGWADAVGVLVNSYFKKQQGEHLWLDYMGKKIKFDFSLIRPKGSPLSWGGMAPGPEPLQRSLDKIEELMDSIIKSGVRKLKPIEAYDIVMHSSDAVLAGGIRRSATICLFSPDDEDMINAKIGDWNSKNPQRARSNNSALLVRGETSWDEFHELIKSTQQFGEPGFVWADDKECLYNPCVEIGLYAYDEHGRSGWQACNLTEINIRKAKTKDDFLKSCRAAAILGTLQAAYTDFSYLGDVSEGIIRREALLGCSMTGMMDNTEIAFNEDLQKEGARIILRENERLAKKIGIFPAARATCVKPAGTSSCILGSSSGVHPHHAKRYFRRVQANEMEPSLKHFKKINPLAVEQSVWSANETDSVITFVCEVPDGSKTKNQIGAIDLLEHVRLTQQNWVEYGTRKKALAQPWLRHNVSNTIHVQEGEWEEVAKYIYKHRKYFAGISLLPESGDKDYMQAPFCAVYTPTEIVRKYGDGSLMAGGLIVDGMHAFDDNLWKACDCALGIGDSLDARKNKRDAKAPPTVFGFKSLLEQKKDWVRRAKQFADRYCDGNLRRLTYLLKDAHNWKLWCDLNREYKDVDWSTMEEDENSKALSVESGAACDGEKCELSSFNGKAAKSGA